MIQKELSSRTIPTPKEAMKDHAIRKEVYPDEGANLQNTVTASRANKDLETTEEGASPEFRNLVSNFEN